MVHDMKKVLMICMALFAMLVSNAQVNAVRCTEDDYNKARYSAIYCSCLPFSIPNLSFADSLRINNLLRHLLAAEGFDKPEYDLWCDKKMLQQIDNTGYIVSYGPKLKGSSDPVAPGRTAFIDTSFQLKGSIVGNLADFDCCAYYIATSEWRMNEPPILHLYSWKDKKAMPKEIWQYAPNDFVAEEYYLESDVLYVKGYEIVDELHKGDTIYMRISVKE